MVLIRYAFIISLISLLSACATAPAPVIDRTPASQTTPSSQTNVPEKAKPAGQAVSKPANGKVGGDWRPDTHVVKKGDTLFSIGLEYGYDYKDIARINNIEVPYIIKIGQTLKLAALKDKPAAAEAKLESTQESGVITYPINMDGSTGATATSTAATKAPAPAIVTLSGPKALREAYSEAALKTPPPASTNPIKAAVTDNKPAAGNLDAKAEPQTKTEPQAKPEAESKPAVETAGTINWIWPTKGKVVSGFNDNGNKGIDIAGTKGQPIVAAAPGKVIYSGSDLRGYGKLVIIKHNNTYLSVYANNSNILVKEGQQVGVGQKIAEMGDTDSNIVKLHFEIRQQGKSVDPAKFLASN